MSPATFNVNIKHIKVYRKNKSRVVSLKNSDTRRLEFLCTCKILCWSSMVARMFGLFPYTWRHDNDQCIYKVSTVWFLYSIIVMILHFTPWFTIKGFTFLIDKPTPEFLFYLTYFINAVYVLVLIINLFRYNDFSRFINKLNKLNPNDLMCNQSKKTAKILEYKMSFCFIGVVLLQVTAFVLWNSLYILDLPQSMLALSVFHVLPFIMANRLIVMIKYFKYMFTCFESLIVNYLKYQSPHPIKTISFRHNIAFFYGFNKYTICDDNHHVQNKKSLPKYQIIEQLRIFHEELYQCCSEFLSNIGLQFLIHIIFQILILTVSWFSWVLYLVSNIHGNTTKAIFTWNFLYLFWHTTTLYWTLKNYHDLKEIVHGLKIILIESTVRCETFEEQQQIRFFINKLEHQVSFTAQNFFTIDLKIIGPITGSIITYILVALQSM